VDHDCYVDCGARPVDEELAAIASGHSKLLDPYDSKHVVGPKRPLSEAADVYPYPTLLPNTQMPKTEYGHALGRFYFFAGFVKARALALGIKVRWGGDWDSDTDFSDQTFDDLVHWEIVD